MCPKADDPLTTDQNDRAITVSVGLTDHSVTLAGQLGITLYGETSYLSLSSPSDSDCKTALENSPQIGTVDCTYTVVSQYQHTIEVVFTSWPEYTPDNNVFANEGNPALTDFYCDGALGEMPSDRTDLLPVSCEFTDIQSTNIKGMCTVLLLLSIDMYCVIHICYVYYIIFITI